MFPDLQEILRMIEAGKLVRKSMFAQLDCDAVLYARDSDPEFEGEWLRIHHQLMEQWGKSAGKNPIVEQLVEDIRRESFMIVTNATKNHEVASYVSDDFELFALASALGVTAPFLETMWGDYCNHQIPVP